MIQVDYCITDLLAKHCPTSPEEHVVVLELRPEERDGGRGGEVSHGAGVVGHVAVEALGAADSPPAQLAVDDALHDLLKKQDTTTGVAKRVLPRLRECSR